MFKVIVCLIAYFGFIGTSISQKNSLVIVSATGNPFFLTVNNLIINEQQQSIVKAFNLTVGWQTVKITTSINKTELKLNDSINIKNDVKYINKEFTYALVYEGSKLKLRFISVSELSGPNEPPVPTEPKAIVPLEDNSIYGILYKAKNNSPIFFDNYDNVNNTCKNTLTTKEINYALTLLTKANNDEQKGRYLTQLIEKNCYTVNQIKLLIYLLEIDMDKLNACKLAYTHLTDKQNAKQLLELLKYESMKDAYSNFLNQQVSQIQLNCSTPITDNQFNELLTLLNKSGYENEKLIAAKKALTVNCFSTVQLKKMGVLFSHDRELLDLYKTAYPVITDKINANTLTTEFKFSETKNEFLKFISN